MEQFTTLSLVKKLLGNIETIGESNCDDKAFKNIANHKDLIIDLLWPIIDIARNNKTGRFSEDRQIKESLDIIKTIKDTLDTWIKEIELKD